MDKIRESIKNNMNDTNPKYIQALMDYYKKQFDYGLISKSAYDDSMRVLSNKLDIANRYQYNLDVDNVFLDNNKVGSDEFANGQAFYDKYLMWNKGNIGDNGCGPIATYSAMIY